MCFNVILLNFQAGNSKKCPESQNKHYLNHVRFRQRKVLLNNTPRHRYTPLLAGTSPACRQTTIAENLPQAAHVPPRPNAPRQILHTRLNVLDVFAIAQLLHALLGQLIVGLAQTLQRGHMVPDAIQNGEVVNDSLC